MLQLIKNQEDIILSWSKSLLQKCFSKNSKNMITIQNNLRFDYLLLAENSDSDLEFNIKGENVTWNIYAIFFGRDTVKSNIQVNISSSDSNVNVYMLSLINSDKQFDINWNIKLWKDIFNSQWHLLEKKLVLGEKIKVKAVPRLDVYSNDVKASHWLSIDRINSDEMFYLNSKWLDESISKELIIRWYIANILNQFKDLSDTEKSEIENQILSKIPN